MSNWVQVRLGGIVSPESLVAGRQKRITDALGEKLNGIRYQSLQSQY